MRIGGGGLKNCQKRCEIIFERSLTPPQAVWTFTAPAASDTCSALDVNDLEAVTSGQPGSQVGSDVYFVSLCVLQCFTAC